MQILIVDDEPNHIQLLEAVLESAGFPACLTATDGRTAVRMCAEQQPDLVFLDLQMPNMDGFEVLNELKATNPENPYLPVLVLTADGSSNARERCYEAGASGFLLKPFNAAEVILRAQELLAARWLYAQVGGAKVKA